MNTYYQTLCIRILKPIGKCKPVILCLVASMIFGQLMSQTASNWNFNNTLSATAGTNITAPSAALSATTVGSFNSGSEYYGEGGWPAGAAADPTVYLQFGLNANTGYYLSLNSLILTLRRSTTGTAAGSGPQQWSLRSSLDNYTTDITTGSLTTSYVATTVALPASFQSIPSTVSFRLYGYNMVVTTGGNNRFVVDNISAQGQAVSGVLAEQLISVQAAAGQQHSVELEWKTEGFAAGTELQIERSVDGTNFSTIYREQTTTANNDANTSADGTSNETADAYAYHYEDLSTPASSRIFYRISASEPDGSVYESAIVAIEENAQQAMQILGVVGQGAGTSVKALLNMPAEGQYAVVLQSSDGKMLSRHMINGGTGRLTTDLDLGYYPHGIYILTLSNGAQSQSREFVY